MTADLPVARVGDLVVRWLGGALLVEHPGGSVLVEAPPGVEVAMAHVGALARLTAVVLPTGRTRSVAGLLGLLDAVTTARGRTAPVTVVHPLDVERAAVVADAWTRGWPDAVRLSLDAASPGVPVDVAGLEVTFVPLALGEPVGDAVVPGTGGGVRLTLDDATVAWAPAARPGSTIRRLCDGATLAVVEVGRRPWPADGAWRPDEAQARELARGAEAAWIVGDDGARIGQEANEA